MSMNFVPFYGYSLGDASKLDFSGQSKLLKNIHDVLDVISDEDNEEFYSNFYTQDEFENNTDFVYGVEAYNLEENKIEFDNMNTGDTSFLFCIENFIKSIENNNIDLDIQPILDLYETVKNNGVSPRIYSVYC